MADKVWVLESPTIKPDRGGGTASGQTETSESGSTPAVASTLSLLIWGAGQFYLRKFKSGLLFLLLMVNFYWISVLAILNRHFLLPFLEPFHIRRSGTLTGIEVFITTGLVIWIFNVLHAYYRAQNIQGTPFNGIDHPVLAILGAFLIPGWGQLLNGQPKKAAIFLLFSAAGLAAAAVPVLVLFSWPMLVSVDDRIAAEWLLVAAGVVLPVVLLMWLIGIYDTVKVGLDPVKKEPFRKRFEYGVNRIRIKGLSRGVLPHLKIFLLWVLILAFTLVLCYFYFPLRSYSPVLRSLEIGTKNRGMVLTPSLIGHLRESISRTPTLRFKDRLPESPPPSPPVNQ